MEKILIVLGMTLFFPILSSAKPADRHPRISVPKIPHGHQRINVPVYKKAFKKAVLRPVGECGNDCVKAAGEILSSRAIRAVNRQSLNNKDVTAIAAFLTKLPEFKSKLEKEGVSPEEIKAILESFTVAAVQSGSWNDSSAQSNVLETVDAILQDGLEAHQEKVEEVRESCNF